MSSLTRCIRIEILTLMSFGGTMRFQSTFKGGLAALIMLPLTACAGGGVAVTGEGELPKVTVSVTHPEDLYGLPWEVAREQGFFEAAGVEVEQIVPSEGGGTTLQNIVSGRLPFGEVATGAVVSGIDEGAPLEVIGGG
ncbi:MAG: ABC transporter substrate-binding protein, partial [Ilumatobacteraceae bacterium]|nr:ABC transporter substrate-binding protein [Ilumatobacteraceae bacterium]